MQSEGRREDERKTQKSLAEAVGLFSGIQLSSAVRHQINPGGSIGKHRGFFSKKDEEGYLGNPCTKYFMSIFISLAFNLIALKLGTVTSSLQKGEPGSTSMQHNGNQAEVCPAVESPISPEWHASWSKGEELSGDREVN